MRRVATLLRLTSFSPWWDLLSLPGATCVQHTRTPCWNNTNPLFRSLGDTATLVFLHFRLCAKEAGLMRSSWPPGQAGSIQQKQKKNPIQSRPKTFGKQLNVFPISLSLSCMHRIKGFVILMSFPFVWTVDTSDTHQMRFFNQISAAGCPHCYLHALSVQLCVQTATVHELMR